MGADYKHSHFQLIGGQVIGNIPANTTSYVNPFGGDDLVGTDRVEIEVPYAAILDRLNIRSWVAPGAGETFTWTLYVNGLVTLLTAQIAGAVDTEADDLVNQIPVADGDTICMEIVTSLNAAASPHRYSMRCKPI